ncbi:MAG: M20/M25/M40 family metallo-hydrolase, partial [Chloroflexota bacterium]
MNATDYAEEHRELFLAELKELLHIPSISTLPENANDMQRAAQWIVAQLRTIGMTTVDIYPTAGHPIIFSSWLEIPDAPTVLVYGHYDVQPVDPIDEWHSDPFDPTTRDGKLYARGSSDDKGQIFAQIKAIDSLMKAHNGVLPVNVKFLIEGEEEIGSDNLDAFIASHQDLLRADVCVISDTSVLSMNQPLIVSSVRGLLYMELEVKGPRQDLHSGGYGGTVHNPAQALCEIVAALHNPDGTVAIPG